LRTPWNLVGLLVLAGMVAAFHVGKAPPALPSIRADLDASLGQAGWLLSIINLVTAVGGMTIALTADRLGHRRLILFGTALCLTTSLVGGMVGSADVLLGLRVLEGLGFISVVVAIPPLLLRIAAARDQRIALAIWSTYMPMGAGLMMLIAALALPGSSWRWVWWIAAAASGTMLLVLLLRTARRHELDPVATLHRPILADMAEVATSGGPLAIGVCFGAYSCCWFAVVGFLPTLQVERLHFSQQTAAIVTTIVTIANVAGNVSTAWLLQRRVPRVTIILSATVSMAICASAIFADGVPDLARLVLAGVYSAVIGVVPGCLFTALPVHAPRPQLVGAATGLLMQISNFGALIGPPITAALVSAGGWPAAAWLTGTALTIAAAAGVFLHWREKRRVAA
jgi:MFS transporter, DHA1 family, inner membrane transport protein